MDLEGLNPEGAEVGAEVGPDGVRMWVMMTRGLQKVWSYVASTVEMQGKRGSVEKADPAQGAAENFRRCAHSWARKAWKVTLAPRQADTGTVSTGWAGMRRGSEGVRGGEIRSWCGARRFPCQRV